MIDIPARYSVDQDDYDPDLGARLLIKLNGAEQDRVVEYDAEAGWVDRVETDAAGEIVIDQFRGTVSIERMSGLVEVGLRPD